MATRIPFVEAQRVQPDALRSIHATVLEQLSGLGRFAPPRHVALVGMGASYAAAAAVLPGLQAAGLSASRHLSSERPAGARWPAGAVVVGISQSGRSPETVDVLAAAREQESVVTVGLANATGSPLERHADVMVGLGGRPDSFASTIGYTGTVLALDLMAGAITGGPREDHAWQELFAVLPGLQDDLGRAAEGLAGRLSRVAGVDAVGSGASVAAAEVLALLLREVGRVPSSANETRNYLHGAMESAGDTAHVLFGQGREVSVAASLAAAGHLTILASDAAGEVADGVEHVSLPPLPAAQRAVAEAAFAQAVAAAVAGRKNLDIESFVFDNVDTKIGVSVPPLSSVVDLP
ncbi:MULTISPECIES: SIS domain-containing protein [unclassified Isoptericola]|uniref:SIS domain-containing protein n=1 Tax=unclassified Isoptericola TaxID=2623355 RepID=UPI00365F3CB3